jgi:hypothetical protein
VTLLDRTKVPSDLWVQRLWVPDGSGVNRQRTVLVTDKRRLLMGGAIMAAGLAVVIGGSAIHAPSMLGLIALVIEVIGGIYAAGGKRSGFYEVAPDGSLGEYLGRKKPDLRAMRPTKAP